MADAPLTAAPATETSSSIANQCIAVTGGAGFIGANVIRQLLDAGVKDIVVLDDFSTGSEHNLTGLPVEIVRGTIEDAALVMSTLGRADGIVHLGAQGSVALSVDNPGLSHSVNVTGTVNVLEAARPNPQRDHAAHVILASSAAVYGPSPELPKVETMATDPASPYASTKIATESYGLAYQATWGVPVLPFRFFNVFGPFQPAQHAYAPVVPAFIDRGRREVPLSVHGDGSQTRDFVYVETVAALIVDALVRRVTSDQPVNVASGTTRSLMDVIVDLEQLLGRRIERAHTDPRQGDIPHSAASTDRLRELFPDIDPVPFLDGLRATLGWWESQSP